MCLCCLLQVEGLGVVAMTSDEEKDPLKDPITGEFLHTLDHYQDMDVCNQVAQDIKRLGYKKLGSLKTVSAHQILNNKKKIEIPEAIVNLLETAGYLQQSGQLLIPPYLPYPHDSS